LSLRPDSTEARYRLVRALFFRAAFCGSGPEERKRIFEEARRTGEEGVARLDAAVAGREGAARAAALRKVPGGGEVLYWAAVAWGEWALGRSRLAAVRAGAPRRIRDLAQRVIDVDPDLEEGGGYRVLGRLHHQSPSIPFVTGWVSRETSLRCLRRAYAAFPDNTVNQYFLAEALLRHERSRREEARTLLARLAAAPPKEEYRVEDAHYAALARDLLARMR
jgi:tetratricopeptide (TPR) repeat protein